MRRADGSAAVVRAPALLAVLLAGVLDAGAAIAWTRKSPQGEWTIICETNHAPAGAVSNAVAVFFADYPRIGEILGVPADAMPRRLELLFATNLPPQVPAHTAGARMTVAASHAARHPDDLRGLLIHEWCHTVQAYPRPDPGWLTEGLADAVRLLLSPADDPWRKRIESVPRDRTDFHHGYGEAARFLLWIRDQGHPHLLSDVNAAMRARICDEAWWTAHVSQSVELWWKQYLQSP